MTEFLAVHSGIPGSVANIVAFIGCGLAVIASVSVKRQGEGSYSHFKNVLEISTQIPAYQEFPLV